MLEVSHLTVQFGPSRVVDDVSFSLEGSEILMLVGPTGCGKTTLLRAIAGLVTPTGGVVTIDGRQIDRKRPLAPEKRGIGMVFQDFALFPHLNVEENIAFRLRDRRPAEDWMARLGLSPLRRAMPQTLSGGQKQRVALARSLAHAPRLMLLDEPLSNLDAAMKEQLRWEIREALKAAGVPAIWVTHDQEEALSVGDRMGVLHNGRLEQLDTAENCFCLPGSRFVAQFLGEASFVPGTLTDGVVTTELGTAPAKTGNGGAGPVDLLVRPDDLSVTAAAPGNAVVEWQRYEGGSRLYTLRLRDGLGLKVRTSHELRLQPGDPVAVRLNTTHPLAAFRREG